MVVVVMVVVIMATVMVQGEDLEENSTDKPIGAEQRELVVVLFWRHL